MSLILNSPYAEPTRHWVHAPGTVSLSEAKGRRAPGYTKFSTKSRGDGEFVPLCAVEDIRPSRGGCLSGGTGWGTRKG